MKPNQKQLKQLCEKQEEKIRIIKEMLKEVIKYINKDIYSETNENTRKKE